MPKALFGTHVAPRTVELLDEIRVLRNRVAELERALEEAEEARDIRIQIDEPEPVKA